MPAHLFLSPGNENLNRPLRLKPIESEDPEIIELNAEVGKMLHLQPPALITEDLSVQCQIPLSPAPEHKMKTQMLESELEKTKAM